MKISKLVITAEDGERTIEWAAGTEPTYDREAQTFDRDIAAEIADVLHWPHDLRYCIDRVLAQLTAPN